MSMVEEVAVAVVVVLDAFELPGFCSALSKEVLSSERCTRLPIQIFIKLLHDQENAVAWRTEEKSAAVVGRSFPAMCHEIFL